jgi:hypothetical protein
MAKLTPRPRSSTRSVRSHGKKEEISDDPLRHKKKETADTHGKCCVKLRFLRRLRAEGVNPWPSDAERQEVCTDILLSIVYL